MLSARIPERAWRAIAGTDPPTAPIGLRAQPSRMDDLTAHAALGLALRIGESMLAVGASAADVTATVLRVAAAYGLTSCQVDITFTSITVSFDREDAVPLTALRIVRVSRLDYTRLQGITDLARAISAGDLDVEEAHRRLDRVVSAPATYRRAVNALAWAGVAGCFGLVLGGGWAEALLAAATTALVEQVLRVLNRWTLPLFFQQVAGAALATGVAVLLLAWEVDVQTPLVVAAGIVVLLAGLSLV
ncbi:MAG TPA: threonine/serine exporter family protein, partial [Geodermatophilus sp.]|nr:threonine/serine exporter family protein [Geodermatophilus sp.]